MGKSDSSVQRLRSQLIPGFSLRLQLCKLLQSSGNGRPLHKGTIINALAIKMKREGKERINPSDNLIDRQQCGDDVINENDHNPKHLAAPECIRITNATHNDSRTVYKHQLPPSSAKYRKHQHHFLGASTQILTYQFR